ncbi:SRPBCC family protein [Phycicoccus sonneratiae]|uniref:SRPBCC family protein n=1 Tax=Phycicoccus sonneratiae TaxID=2807628 RepID=A0ABS2CNU9_9MICO|nr:SRPBCC family protein [Phycicoccus sonneraticus]MBM6401555.1 SRPBCC family protein [Phycicoccus sonneraticus]
MIADRWGVTDAEVASPFGCDELLPGPVLAAWRGVSVAAPAERVWPWVTQIRVAPYSYDWVDNLGRRSPRTLLDLEPPRVGEPFTRAAGHPTGEVLAVDEGRELTGRILGALMSYRLDPQPGGGSRLLLKLVMARGRLLAPLVSVGDLVMARRQLLTLKELAERG